jgi:LPS export ABC transporter protein LptC
MKRNIFWMLVLVAVAGCRDGATTPSPAATPEEMRADQILYGMQHRMSHEGIQRALMYGDTAYVLQGGGNIDVVGVRMIFFDEQGRETGNLTSQTGTYQLRAGTMVAQGNVILNTRGEGGERILETEQLHFDINGDRLWSDQAVVMREGGREIRGTSFQSDGRFQNVTVTRAQTGGAPINTPEGGISF